MTLHDSYPCVIPFPLVGAGFSGLIPVNRMRQRSWDCHFQDYRKTAASILDALSLSWDSPMERPTWVSLGAYSPGPASWWDHRPSWLHPHEKPWGRSTFLSLSWIPDPQKPWDNKCLLLKIAKFWSNFLFSKRRLTLRYCDISSMWFLVCVVHTQLLGWERPRSGIPELKVMCSALLPAFKNVWVHLFFCHHNKGVLDASHLLQCFIFSIFFISVILLYVTFAFKYTFKKGDATPELGLW